MTSLRVPVARPFVSRVAPKRISRPVAVRLSPVSIELMSAFDARGAGLSAMLLVFIFGRIVIDLAEHSIHSNQAYDSSDSDDD